MSGGERANPGFFRDDEDGGRKLTPEEAQVFGIKYEEFPRMMTVWEAWFAFLGYVEASTSPASRAYDSLHRSEVQRCGTLANFSTIRGAFFDCFAEVEANEDTRIRVLGRRLREAGIRAKHW